VEDLVLGQLQAALELVRDVQAAPDLPAYIAAVLGVGLLVPGNVIGYNEVNVETGETHAVIDPPEAAFEGVEDVFATVANEHPVMRHFQETGDPSPRALSDFLSEEELHGLDLYRLIFAPMGVEDQISFILPSPPNLVVGVAINRAQRGFDEQERLLLGLVQPNLGQAFRDARARTDPLGDEHLGDLGLSPREAEVMRLLAAGKSSDEIVASLVISPHTLRRHVAQILEKLEVSTRAAAVARVLRPQAPLTTTGQRFE
jgi:DNA-binding CsgD family transcriptional regulator